MAPDGRHEKPILVTGATGKQGGATARHLIANGWCVRALTRDPLQPKAASLAALGAEVVQGDLDDESSVRAALAGMHGVFSVQSFAEHGTEGEVRQGILLADLALQHGIKHFVYASVGGAERSTGINHFETKHRIENHIRRIGLRATILRPVALMESFTYPLFITMLCSGILPGPQKPEDRWQVIAADDVGRIAAAVFANQPIFAGKELEIAGDEMTMLDAASIFSRVIGRPVRYLQLSSDQLHPELTRQLAGFLGSGGFHADVPALRSKWPDLMTLESWLYRCRWDRLGQEGADIDLFV